MRPTQEEYNKLISQLRALQVDELLYLYIEAKTGTQKDIDKIPVYILEAIDDLGAMLNTFYADSIIDSLFEDNKEDN